MGILHIQICIDNPDHLIVISVYEIEVKYFKTADRFLYQFSIKEY